jgi:hypothetical protein
MIIIDFPRAFGGKIKGAAVFVFELLEKKIPPKVYSCAPTVFEIFLKIYILPGTFTAFGKINS